MKAIDQGPAVPRVRPRQSLSGRLWLLTTLVVLLTELAVFLPDIAHERHAWLSGRVEDAALLGAAVDNSRIGDATRGKLRALFGTEAISLVGTHGDTVVLAGDGVLPDATVDLQEESLLGGMRHGLGALMASHDRLVRVVADDPLQPGAKIVLVFHERVMSRVLRDFAANFAGLGLLIAAVAGGLVYLVVLVLLVRPMRRLTGSIAAFRDDPERTVPLDPSGVSVLPNDEIAVAGRELAAMQHELRAALWRNARLAALGTMVAKVSHDLRGILTPALLTAERLQLSTDPKVRRAGDVLVQGVDRASDLVRRALDYAREGPPPLDLRPVRLAPLVDEVAETIRVMGSGCRLDNHVGGDLLVRADRNQLFRVLANLLRNAAQAGAPTVRVTARRADNVLAIDIADDGPGLPDISPADLFRPFAGSMRRGGTGLGLAIVRDLMVAHGGAIELVATGAGGTNFRLTLPAIAPVAGGDAANDGAASSGGSGALTDIASAKAPP